MAFEVKKHLTAIARELGRIAADVRAAVRQGDEDAAADTRDYWSTRVTAPQTLGADVSVARWALVENFLKTWTEWHNTANRWQQYFGQEVFPTSWQKTVHRCEPLAARFMNDHNLVRTIVRAWEKDSKQSQSEGAELGTPAERFHAFLDSRAKCALAEWFSPNNNPDAEHLTTTAYREHDRCGAQLRTGGADFAEEIAFYTLNYRHATLRLPWLGETEDGEHWAFFESPRKRNMDSSRHLGNLGLSPDQHKSVQQICERLDATLDAIGYEAFVDDLTAEDFVGGSNSPVGVSDINLIPGRAKGLCCPTLLAVSKGSGNRSLLSFSRVIEEVKTHLFVCKDKTRLVLFLCDHWDSKAIQREHLTYLRACYDNGVRFVFLLVGPTGRTFSAVSVNLERA